MRLIVLDLFSQSISFLSLKGKRLRRWIHNYRSQWKRGNDKIPKSPSHLGLVAAVLPATPLAYGVTLGAHGYKVTRRKLPIKNLPPELDGFRIGHFSDIHAGSLHSRKGVAKGIFKLMDEHPDMIFFTGDLVNNSAHELDTFHDLLAMVSAPMGVYSILGNHDYGYYRKWESKMARRENLVAIRDRHREFGWHLLMNEHRVVEMEEASIGVIGVENWGKSGRMPKRGNLKKAISGMPEVDVKLLLSHDPSHWREKVLPYKEDIDITFSGHTHGMQFGVHTRYFKWSPVRYLHKQWSGLYKHNDQYLYVNRGFGHHGFPGRIGMPPEITIIELKRAR